jgi:hypothetical protein
MRTKLAGVISVLILRDGGRAPTQIDIPKWLVSLVHSCALTFLGCVGFVGWQLQAVYGLQGHQVAHLGLDSGAERWSLFESLAPSNEHERTQDAQERADRLGLGDRRAAGALLSGVVASEWSDEASMGGDVGDGQLRWPVQGGYFGRGYASGENNYHLAVDIGGELRADVGAAAPGIVGYVGNELRGYGNVVLVVHPGGWVTLYGHNQRVLVHAGERVRQGQTIALLGSTGRSEGPHVHFELIFQGRNCDPLPFVRHADITHLSAATPTPEVEWNPWLPKPRAVRCHKRMMHPVHEEDDQSIAGARTGSTPRG